MHKYERSSDEAGAPTLAAVIFAEIARVLDSDRDPRKTVDIIRHLMRGVGGPATGEVVRVRLSGDGDDNRVYPPQGEPGSFVGWTWDWAGKEAIAVTTAEGHVYGFQAEARTEDDGGGWEAVGHLTSNVRPGGQVTC